MRMKDREHIFMFDYQKRADECIGLEITKVLISVSRKSQFWKTDYPATMYVALDLTRNLDGDIECQSSVTGKLTKILAME